MGSNGSRQFIGVAGMFVASLLFGLMAFFVRIISSEVHNFVLVFVRAMGGVLFFLLL